MEKEKKINMKVIIPVIVAIVIIVVLSVIIIKKQKDIKVMKENNSMSNTNEIMVEQDGTTTISLEEFLNHIKKVDITTENWKDYFEFEQTTEETKDPFGEVTGLRTHNIIKLKDNNLSYSSYAILEIEIPKEKAYYDTKQIAYLENENSYEFFNYINGAITIDEITCTKAKGSVFYLDFSDNYWNLDKEKNKNFICLKETSSVFGKYYKNGNLISFLHELKNLNNNYKELISNCSALNDIELLK